MAQRDRVASGGVVAAVCHGPVALVNVKNADGSFLVSGRSVTAFTNDEEEAVGLTKTVPFLLEDRLKERGATFVSGAMWAAFVKRDGKLITGQNPASSAGVAEAILAALAE